MARRPAIRPAARPAPRPAPRRPAPSARPPARPQSRPRVPPGPRAVPRPGHAPGAPHEGPPTLPRARLGSRGLVADARAGGYQLDAEQARVAGIILGEGRRLGAPSPALVASMYAALGETDLGTNPRTYQNNGVGYWGVLQGDMQSWPDPHDIAGQALAFFTGRGPQGQTDFHVGAINWVKQGVTFPPEIAVRTEVPSIWPADAYAKEWAGGEQQGIDMATSIVSQVTGTNVPAPRGGGHTPTPGGVPGIVVSGNLYNLMTQLDYAGLDINLWKSLNASGGTLASDARSFLRKIQRTAYVTPHKAG